MKPSRASGLHVRHPTMSLITRIEIEDGSELQRLAASKEFDLHGYLSDDADWNAPYWAFEVNRLDAYCRRLRTLFNSTGTGFSFQALWAGEHPTKVQAVSIDELIALLLSSKLGTKTQYFVRKNA